MLKRIEKAMDEALESAGVQKEHIAAIGIGAPGVVDSARGVVVQLTNLPGWHNVPLARALQRWHDVPVMVSNDVRMAAVAEHRVGAGQGVHSMVAVFIGTGIGGGIILNDQLWVGWRASAGEIGHMVVLADGPMPSAAGYAAASRPSPAAAPLSASCAPAWPPVAKAFCRSCSSRRKMTAQSPAASWRKRSATMTRSPSRCCAAPHTIWACMRLR